MQYFEFQNTVLFVVFAVLAVVKLYALVDAILRPPGAFVAADKQTKTAWLWILGLAFVAHVVFQVPYSLLSLLGTVAAFVYLIDVRPALSAVTRRR